MRIRSLSSLRCLLRREIRVRTLRKNSEPSVSGGSKYWLSSSAMRQTNLSAHDRTQHKMVSCRLPGHFKTPAPARQLRRAPLAPSRVVAARAVSGLWRAVLWPGMRCRPPRAASPARRRSPPVGVAWTVVAQPSACGGARHRPHKRRFDSSQSQGIPPREPRVMHTSPPYRSRSSTPHDVTRWRRHTRTM